MVDVYLVHLQNLSPELLNALSLSLSDDEQNRFQQFIRKQRATQFLVGRCLLRKLLSKELNIPAAKVPLVERKNNSPSLKNKLGNLNHQINFNLSHSGEWVACAIGFNIRVGLDIEVINKDRDVLALAEHVFDKETIHILKRCGLEDQILEFYRHWTLKEAQYKLHSTCNWSTYLSHPTLTIALCADQIVDYQPKLIIADYML